MFSNNPSYVDLVIYVGEGGLIHRELKSHNVLEIGTVELSLKLFRKYRLKC